MSEQDETTIVWADVAKAMCIILVVMLHSGQVAPGAGWNHYDATQKTWDTLSLMLRPIRMPAFFLISGILASSSILSPRDDTLWKRLIKPAYLYFVWAMIFAATIPHYPNSDTLGLSIWGRARIVMLAYSPAWYMIGLAGFYCVASVSRNWNLHLLLLGCAALSMFASIMQPYLGAHTPIARCLIFFVVGVRMKDQVLDFARTSSIMRVMVAGCLYAVAASVSAMVDRFLLPVDMLAVAFVVQLVTLLAAKCSAIVAPARWLGKRTLLVYLLHFPVLVFLTAYCRTHLGTNQMSDASVSVLFPLVIGIISLPVSLILGEAMQMIGLGKWLFDLPPALRLKNHPLKVISEDNRLGSATRILANAPHIG